MIIDPEDKDFTDDEPLPEENICEDCGNYKTNRKKKYCDECEYFNNLTT